MYRDVIVIGTGPTGMSAALRARRPKTFDYLPSDVLIFEEGEAGGLSSWKETYFTSPGWSYKRDELRKMLLSEMERYCIELRKERVISAELHGKIKRIITDRREYEALAVVIATGMRNGANEWKYFGKGLYATLRSVDVIKSTYKEICGNHERIIFVGSERMELALSLWNEVCDKEPMVFIEDEKNRVLEIFGEGKVEGLRVSRGGDIEEIRADAIIVDFESYMLRPTTQIFDVETENGFIKVDRLGRTSIPGVFASGDITGPPFSVAKAVGEGVVAGIEAYRYAYRMKFKKEAPAFAFYPLESDDGLILPEIPEPEDDWVIRAVDRNLSERYPFMRDGITCKEFRAHFKNPDEEFRRMLRSYGISVRPPV